MLNYIFKIIETETSIRSCIMNANSITDLFCEVSDNHAVFFFMSHCCLLLYIKNIQVSGIKKHKTFFYVVNDTRVNFSFDCFLRSKISMESNLSLSFFDFFILLSFFSPFFICLVFFRFLSLIRLYFKQL